jgi:L1 cell adhesion molecule like protein
MGEFDLAGIPPMPRGVPQIEVSYDLDANGILNVSASEKSTGKSSKITITNDKSRTKEDIERMVAEAARYEAEDKVVVERVEARNGAEAYLYNARNSIQEEKGVLSATDQETVESTVKAGLAWLDEHREAEKEAVEEQKKVWEDAIRPVLMKLYATQAGKPGVPGGVPGGASEGSSGVKVEEVD